MSKVIQRFSTTTVVFSEEQPLRGDAPRYQESAAAFAKAIGTDRIASVEGERWQTGPWMWNSQVRVAFTAGNAFELSAGVEGTTLQSRDVLQEVWHTLGEVTKDSNKDLTEVTGNRVAQTFTSIRAGEEFERKLAPFLAAAKLAGDRAGGSVPGPFKIEFVIRIDLGSMTLERPLVIERRMLTKPEQQVYWVGSPLASDDHDKLLTELFGPIDS